MSSWLEINFWEYTSFWLYFRYRYPGFAQDLEAPIDSHHSEERSSCSSSVLLMVSLLSHVCFVFVRFFSTQFLISPTAPITHIQSGCLSLTVLALRDIDLESFEKYGGRLWVAGWRIHWSCLSGRPAGCCQLGKHFCSWWQESIQRWFMHDHVNGATGSWG